MTTKHTTASVSHRRSFFAWILFCIIAGGTWLVYALTALAVGRGEYVLPLDDVYIHFQYAHQLANGQPYIYNPGLPPTSGATSLLYPYLLALGDWLGFRELNLGIWAMSIGALALLGSMWLIYQCGRQSTPDALAAAVAAAFGLTGAFVWHAMSGMETGLALLLLLLTLYGFSGRRFALTVAGATLLALIRPELGVAAALTAGAWGLAVWWGGEGRTRQVVGARWTRQVVGARWTRYIASLLASSAPSASSMSTDARIPSDKLYWFVVPLLAMGVQPLVNWLATGSAVASGNQAKSIFGSVPFYPEAAAERIFDQFVRMWREFVLGFSERDGTYMPAMLIVFAVLGLLALLADRQRRLTGLLILAWLLAVTLAVATLDTAFWHFKRYQMPVMALFFPLAAWGAGWLWSLLLKIRPLARLRSALLVGIALLLIGSALTTSGQFWRAYAVNGSYVYLQPLQMARWLRYNTPADSVVAVHDTGMLRYQSVRTTIDMVGLTTPGAADYWRNGPGAVAEYLIQTRPDYIASYGVGHGFGLGFLADTSLYGEPLAAFPVLLDHQINVALAADFQGIYRPNWTAAERQTAMQPSSLYYMGDGTVLAALNVANIASENAFSYAWQNVGQTGGFPSDVYDIDYIACAFENCRAADGGRRINRAETFEFTPPDAASGVLLISRIHPVNPGTLDVYINDTLVDTRWIPPLPGSWLELATRIPSELLTTPTRVRIAPNMGDGHYLPYHHWLYVVSGDTALPGDAPFSTFQAGAIRLYNPQLQLEERRLHVDLLWGTDGNAQGDYKVFVHVLAPGNDQPLAQYDNRPLNGSLPPGNWLPGVIPDRFVVDLTDIPSGRYRVALGLYDPVTFERLIPTGGDDAGRLFLGEVEVGNG